MYKQLADAAVKAAYAAGRELRRGFGTDFKIYNKEGRNNLVTEFDTLSEKMIIEMLGNDFPDSNFLAEESGKSGIENKKITWVIDPLDGTVNFAHKLPIFSISIAAVIDNEIVAGVIYHPVLDEIFVAIKGQGATRNGAALSVSQNDDYSTAFLVTGFPYNVYKNPCNCIDHFVDVIRNGNPVRRLGSAALDLAYVAAGIFDGFWEIDLNPWDVAAGILLIREAGGKVTEFNGNEYNLFDRTLIASSAKMHPELVKKLSTCNHYIKL